MDSTNDDSHKQSSSLELEREIRTAALDILNQIETDIETQQMLKDNLDHLAHHANNTTQTPTTITTTHVDTSIQIELSEHVLNSTALSSARLNAGKYEEDNKTSTTTREQSDLLNHEIMNLDSNLANQILTGTLLEKETYVSHGVNVDEVKDNELEQIAVEAITDTNENKKHVKAYLNELKAEIRTLTQRCDQFNDVKQTIKSMNDLIREEIFLDFGSIITMMRCKLDELTNQIKEKLKDAYSVVRDRQEKITSRLDEIKHLSERIERDNSFDDATLDKLKQTRDQIDLIYDELRQICDSAAASTTNPITVTAASVINSISNCSNNCSLFIDNNLYPQFNYFIDMSKLIADIDALQVQISSTSTQQNNFNRMSLIPNENASIQSSDLFYDYSSETSYYCKVTSRLSNDGSFWIKVLCAHSDIGDLDENNNNLDDYDSTTSSKRRHVVKCLDKTNVFIEEVSKYVRRKRIGDKSWQTYSEAKREPTPGEKCFFLENKTRKWLRATIESFDSLSKSCQIRLMDTGGHLDTCSSLDNLLVWHDDFELARTAPRSLKCYLELANNLCFGDNNEICLETKFLFKDTVVQIDNLKCTLLRRKTLNSNDWIIKLCDRQQVINDLISDFNRKELNCPNEKTQFRSTDIRVDSGQIAETKTPKQEEANTSHEEESKPQQVEHEEPVTIQQQLSQITSDYSDIEDQKEERRGYKLTTGVCYVHRPIAEDGTFWIKPALDTDSDLYNEYKNMSTNLGEYIVKTQWKPYGLLNINPEVGRKCFVRVAYSTHTEWYRGQIERAIPPSSPKKYVVRTLDLGFLVDASLNDIYPHRRFSSDQTSSHRSFDTKLEYLAIRCSLTPNGYPIRLNQNSIRCFYKLIADTNGSIVFNLVEQVKLHPHSKRMCWHAELKVCAESPEIINYKVLETALFDPGTVLGNRFRYIQLIRSKALMLAPPQPPVAMLQQSKSTDLSQRSSEPNSSINASWPSNNDEQKRQAKSRKKRNNNRDAKNESRPLRRKSKSFDQIAKIASYITTKEKSEKNEQQISQNDEYHTIASGTGIAAAAVALQQSADLSTKYQHYKEKQPSSSSSNNTYSSLPYSSPLQNTSLKPPASSPLQMVNSNTIVINNDENTHSHRMSSKSDVSSKSKHSNRRSNRHQHRSDTNCKADAKYNASNNERRDDDDDNNDDDRHNHRRRAHTTANSNSAYHRSFGEQHSQSNRGSNSNRNRSNYGGRNHDDGDYYYDDDDDNDEDDEEVEACECCNGNVFLTNQPTEQTIMAENSYLAGADYNDLPSVFMPSESKSKQDANECEEITNARHMSEKLAPHSQSSRELLMNILNEESHIELSRTSVPQEDLNLNQDKQHMINRDEDLKESLDLANQFTRCQLQLYEEEEEMEEKSTSEEKENLCNTTTLAHDATQAIAYRHLLGSPLMSTDSSQKYIHDQLLVQQSQQLLAGLATHGNKQRSHSDDYSSNNKFLFNRQPIVNTPPNNRLIASSSSSSSAASSFNKTPQNKSKLAKKTSSGTLNKEDDENDELYQSCAEDLENNNNLVNLNTNNNNNNNNNEVEDYDDDILLIKKFNQEYGFIKNSSPNTLIAPLIQDDNHTLITQQHNQLNSNKEAQTDELSLFMNHKRDKLKNFTVAIFIDSFEDYSLNKSINSSSSSETESLPKPIKENVVVNSSELVVDDQTKTSSLREFEQQEANLLQQNKPQLSDEVFMFNSNPNNYDNLLHFKSASSLVSKPPLIPSSLIFLHHQQHQHQQQNSNNVQFLNLSGSNQCLSTITECSNETYETCSNQSPKNQDQEEAYICAEKNITLRRGRAAADKRAANIDELFAKFCLQANDEIMLSSSEESFTSTSSSSSQAITVQNQQEQEKLDAKVDTPTFSSSSSSSSSDSLVENARKTPDVKLSSAGGLETNNFENLDEVEDEVFLKSNPNQLVKLSSSSSSSSEISPVMLVEKVTTPPVVVASPNLLTKLFKSKGVNMNMSSTTTLEISSYTSDSLFNSNFVVTPMYSDAVSPGTVHFLNATNPSLSLVNNNNLINSQQSPLTLSTPHRLNDCVDSKSVKPIIKQQQTPSPPPLPPLPSQFQSGAISPTTESPLPPPPPLPSGSIQSPFSDKSSPFPPPPLAQEFLFPQAEQPTKVSQDSASKPKELKKTVTSQQLNSKKNLIKQTNGTQSLIETLTARLNLISNNNSNNSSVNTSLNKSLSKIETKSQEPTPSVRPVQAKIKILSPPKINNSSVNSNLANIITTNNNINKAGYASLGSLFKANLQKSPVTLTSNKANNNSRTESVNEEEEEDDEESSQQWRASNLYGLDTEEYDDQHSLKDHEELDNKSFPPPPTQFDDASSLTKTPSSSRLNLPLPTPPSFKQAVQHQQQPQNISLNTTNDTIRRFWTNLTSNSVAPEPPIATTSLKPASSSKKPLDLNNNLNLIREQVNQSCPNMTTFTAANNNCSFNKVESESSSHISSTDSYVFNEISDQSEQFKLDHLINITPKHLFKSCKFKARIHDIIDENGQFWLEVIYSKSDEIKFNQVFRLFRLCSKISHAPKTLYVQKFVSAMYKDNWHRAIVLELNNEEHDNRVLVRFLDLGIVKYVDRYIELREIDEKFFNFPLKSLHCTILLDSMRGVKLSREARKFFTRLIYKRVLFVKVVDFIDLNQTKSSNLVLHQNRFAPSQLCQIILGCQTQRGIIDACMYLMSKFDRKRYESIKAQRDLTEHASVATTTAATISSSMTNLRNVLCDQNLTRSTSTSYLNLPSNPNSRMHQKPQRQQQQQQQILHSNHQQYYDEIDTRKRIKSYEEEDHHDDEDLEDYAEEKANQSVDLNDTELLDNIYEPDQTDSESNQYENDAVLTNHDRTDDNAVFTDILNSCCIDANNLIFNVDNTILYRESEEEQEGDDAFDYGLDYLPVKDDNNTSKSSHKARSFNYSEMLRFDSIHLPPPPPTSEVPVPVSDFKTPMSYANLKNGRYTGSTVVASRTKYIRHMNHFNMPFPPSNPLTSSQMNALNYSSDTDSSMQHGTACCSGPIKLKWNATANNIQKFKLKLNKSKEAPELSSIVYNNVNDVDAGFNRIRSNNASNLSSKKVKFQIR